MVEGAVSMAQMAVAGLAERGIAELDEERKAAMVSKPARGALRRQGDATRPQPGFDYVLRRALRETGPYPGRGRGIDEAREASGEWLGAAPSTDARRTPGGCDVPLELRRVATARFLGTCAMRQLWRRSYFCGQSMEDE